MTTNEPLLNCRPARVQRLPWRRAGPPGCQQGGSPLPLPSRHAARRPRSLLAILRDTEPGHLRVKLSARTTPCLWNRPRFTPGPLVVTMRRVARAATLYHRDGCAVTASTPHLDDACNTSQDACRPPAAARRLCSSARDRSDASRGRCRAERAG